jgi:hypothetical protein
MDCFNTRYSFEMPIKAYPDSEIIGVFDTIFFEVNVSTSSEDLNTRSLIDFSGASNLGTFLGVIKYDSLANQWNNEDPNNFLCFPISGYGFQQDQSSFGINYIFSEIDRRYRFLLAFLPRYPGLYCAVFSNSNNTYRRSDVCTKANFIINFKDTDQHYDLHPSYVPGSDITSGAYYFMVR